MRDILDHLRSWGEPFALATVVGTWQSAPRPAGAAMAVSASGEVVGSVSGGCVEAAVYEACLEVLSGARPHVATYGVSDDDAFAVGLTCGGTIEVFVRLGDPAEVATVAEAVDERQPAAVATVVGAADVELVGRSLVVVDAALRHGTGRPGLDDGLVTLAGGLLAHGRNGTVHVGTNGERRMEEVTVFVESYAPPPRMIIFGAIDFAAALAHLGSYVGYHVTVCDARPVFTTRRRFPDVDELVVAWPHEYLRTVAVDERTVLCVLTHDPKFDVPLIVEALRTPAAYIGVMGSRRSTDERAARLAEHGVTQAQLARLSSPTGLDLGGSTPEETALSIMAEIVAHRSGGTGRPLSELSGPIHRTRVAVPG
ncbi:XdhC family protein [Georgenia sp. H159]|uniref:XdhC family protein n=1 Tax=Georgenia sp. H159 TaxID=3076115 RepID=UPI002D78241B|nr:XdhC family protein [Georgenia sp. H159]